MSIQEAPHLFEVFDGDQDMGMLVSLSFGERERFEAEAEAAGHPDEKLVPISVGNLALKVELVPNTDD